MKSKRFAALVLASAMMFATSSCTMWGEKKHASWKSATSGEHLINLFWGDVKAKDWQNLDAHIGPRFIGMNSAGTEDREKLLGYIRSVELQEFQVGEIESRMAGGDLIVTYTITAKGTADGRPLASPQRMMSVWQELKHGWVLVAQSTMPAS